jgi:hypothetical protein
LRDQLHKQIHWLGWIGVVPSMAMAVLLVVQGWGYSQFSVDGTYLLSFITTHTSNWLSGSPLNASSPTTVKIYLVTEFVGHTVYALAFWRFTQIPGRVTDWKPLALLFTQFVLIWVCRLDLGYWTVFAIAVLLPLRLALAYFLVLLSGIWCVRALEAFVFHFELIIGFKICLFTNNLRFSASPVGFLQLQQFRKMDPVYIMIRLFMEVRFVYI